MSTKTKIDHRTTMMHGLPKVYLDFPIHVVITESAATNAVPQDADHCAIALACRDQLGSPYVHIMRYRAWVAMPHKKGKPVENLPGLWAMHGFDLSASARASVIAVDTDTVTADMFPMVIDLLPVKQGDRPKNRKARLQAWRDRVKAGTHVAVVDGRGKSGERSDILTLQGVRNYRGRAPR